MLTKWQVIVVVLLSVGLLGVGSGVLAYHGLTPTIPWELPPTPELAALANNDDEKSEKPPAANKAAPAPKASGQKDGKKDIAARDVVSQSFKTGKAPKVIVELYNGSIDLTANAEGAVQARVTKEGRGQTDDAAREALKNVDVKMTQEGDTVRVKASQVDEHARLSSGASAELKVPAGATLELHTSNGSVTLTGGTGAVHAHTSNGKVEARGSKGPLTLQTSNGKIAVTCATGRLELKTSNGAIVMDAQKAVVNAVTANGPVQFSGTLAAGQHTLRTSNGGIVVQLPSDSTFDLEAETSHGAITTKGFSTNKATGKGQLHLRTSVGRNPNVALKLHTSNGSITVRPQQGAQQGNPKDSD